MNCYVYILGIGLMEIITEPEFCSAAEAASFVRELQLILQTIGVCDGKMEGMMAIMDNVKTYMELTFVIKSMLTKARPLNFCSRELGG